MIGPSTEYSQQLHFAKYRIEGESFDDYAVRYCQATSDDETHFRQLLDPIRQQRILPAGRQQLAVGRPFDTTAMNCFVGGAIPDSSEGIMDELKNTMLTLRTGGGDGWDFSTLRPYGDKILGLGEGAYATGPVSFMGVWDALCDTILSAGHRRGAMMAVLRIDHPDIERFINSKAEQGVLTNFNISVGVTNAFMKALTEDGEYDLVFKEKVYGKAKARTIWSRIMERNWDWAEPGVLFIDRINEWNPLNYCEEIAATNPCGEQPLPPHGACLLGSVNVVKYLVPKFTSMSGDTGALSLVDSYDLDYNLMYKDIEATVRAFDNVIDLTNYPLEQQAISEKMKRRMGIGPTGMANALEIMGHSYGSPSYIEQQNKVMEEIRDAAYEASIQLGNDKGSFGLFQCEEWLKGRWAQTLPQHIQDGIAERGLRNGLLLSVAPTGTISQCADNVSSGIEPPYLLECNRLVHIDGEQVEVEVSDYAYREYGVSGKTAEEVSAEEHVKVLCAAQHYVDSAISKTCNVLGEVKGESPTGKEISFKEFKQLYMMAWEGGAKGCTTFNANGERMGIFKKKEKPQSDQGVACTIDPETGVRTCDG